MASIQRIVSPLTKDVSYRAQVRVKGRSSEAATFPNRKEAEAWAASIETAIREGRHFPHAAAKRTSFDALAKDYAETVLVEFDQAQRAARTLQLNWWSKQVRPLGSFLRRMSPTGLRSISRRSLTAKDSRCESVAM